MKSLFADYFKEKLGCTTIETEFGFVVYQIFEDEFFVREYYIVPEKRCTKLHSYFFSEIDRIAKENNCKMVSASIDIKSIDPETPLIFNLKNGFKIHSLSGNRILLTRELENERGKSGKES